MDNFNYDFFEEYKVLDKLCRELYGGQNGITQYIDDMKNVSRNNYQHIPKWKEDLDQLIRVRHIRNYLAHTEGAFKEEICTQRDIEWVQDFYRRILNQSDPLARLHQYSKVKQKAVKSRMSDCQFQTPEPSVQYNIADDEVEEDKEMKGSYWIMLLLFVVVILLLIIFGIVELFG